MPAARTHITSQGEAWDQVAKKLWGSESLAHDLLAANPRHRDLILFPAGIELTVPDIEIPVSEEPPPWKER